MKYLVNPSEKNILENAGDRVPIGLMSIASNNPDTKVFDLNHTSERDFFKQFNKERPTSVGISVYTSPLYEESIRLAKKLKGKTKLIAGGYHASAMPETLTPYFDTVVIGEGERGYRLAQQVDGIIVAENPNLDDLRNPSGLEMSVYGINQNGKRTGTIISSRGCPYSCAFCGKMSDNVRYSPVKKVLKQASTLKGQGFEAIYFTDDVFTIKKDRMKHIVENLELPFRVTTRANMINESKADIFSYNGCEIASFGIESGNDEILKRSNKGMTRKDNYNAIKLMSERGIKTKGFFIIGLPGETKETARQTIDFSKELRDIGLTSADFYFLTPFPGTPIWRNPEKFGITINDRNFIKYLQAGKTARCVIETEHLNSQSIEDLVSEAKNEWKN